MPKLDNRNLISSTILVLLLAGAFASSDNVSSTAATPSIASSSVDSIVIPPETTCQSQTINYITHTLPQQCLRTTYTRPTADPAVPEPASTSTPTSADISERAKVEPTESASSSGSEQEAFVVVPTSSDDANPATSTSSETSALTSDVPEIPTPPQSDPSVRPEAPLESETDSPLDNSNFLSFEEWKQQNLAKVGQNPETLGKGRTSGSEPRRRPANINNALDALGDDAEIEIDFSGFGGKSRGEGHDSSWSDAGDGSSGTAAPTSSDLGSANPRARSIDAGKTCKERFNYASFDCAATVLKTNPQCKSSSSVLVESKDSYMLNECGAANKFVIIELCNDILVDTVVLANFEFFSSMTRTFRVSVSDRYPVKLDRWKELGIFEARNTRDIQAFLVPNPLIWARYLRIEFLSHYGNEFYCPTSLIRVHGTTMMEEYKHEEAMARADEDPYLEDEVVGETSSTEAVKPVDIGRVQHEKRNMHDESHERAAQPVDPSTPPLTTKEAVEHPTPSSYSENASNASSQARELQGSSVVGNSHASQDLSQSDPPIGPTTYNAPTGVSQAHAKGTSVPTSSLSSDTSSDDAPASAGASSASAFASSSSIISSSPPAADVPTGSSTPDAPSNHTAGSSASHAKSEAAAGSSLSSDKQTKSASAAAASASSTASGSSSSSAGAASSSGTSVVAPSKASQAQAQPPPPPPDRPAASVANPQAPSPTTQESFFKSVHKRLQMLESNSTLSLQYIEEQSRILRDAFTKVEKRQLSKTEQFLKDLNATVMNELKDFRQQYDQLWQSTVLELTNQREQNTRENYAISSRMKILTEELVFQKRMNVVQSTLLLLCLGLVLFVRPGSNSGGAGAHLELPLMQHVMNKSQSMLRLSFDSRPGSPVSVVDASGRGAQRRPRDLFRDSSSRDSDLSTDGSPIAARRNPAVQFSPPSKSPSPSPQPETPASAFAGGEQEDGQSPMESVESGRTSTNMVRSGPSTPRGTRDANPLEWDAVVPAAAAVESPSQVSVSSSGEGVRAESESPIDLEADAEGEGATSAVVRDVGASQSGRRRSDYGDGKSHDGNDDENAAA
ncbi:hypothetical protein K402DRAFT_394241 [Aulographum hederae CBS 113979]|uniref:SUN domain-containing protein n=1 Tax=Aulographum hederae CBS 113979 TaxID=1176131 RepID=A0A6G1GYZ2_9PEZI|nr:hypothetical protein K402DRAFT_394241 [Aulographum hederae CBS 113979]